MGGVTYFPKSHFRKPWCPAGHYKPEVGIYTNGSKCVACAKETAKLRLTHIILPAKESMKKPWCPKGHKKWEVGTIHGRCAECTREYQRAAWRKKYRREVLAPPQKIHDKCEEVRLLCGLNKADFCREVGIPRSTYGEWVYHGRPASSRNIQTIVPELHRLLHERNELIRKEQEVAARQEAELRIKRPEMFGGNAGRPASRVA